MSNLGIWNPIEGMFVTEISSTTAVPLQPKKITFRVGSAANVTDGHLPREILLYTRYRVVLLFWSVYPRMFNEDCLSLSNDNATRSTSFLNNFSKKEN